MGRRGRPVVPTQRPPNPFRTQKEIKATTPIRQTPVPVKAPPKQTCPDKQCPNPKIEDGVCITCGSIVDDYNMVSEVQFGENSQGAAVPQGTYLSADQGATRGAGVGARPGLGHVDRDKIVQEGKPIMHALSNQLLIPESTIQSGLQILKLAAQQNFIQGRRMDMVAAVCLYSACRKERPCRVMLIDFADRIQVNVFKLGHTFKALHMKITMAKDGIQPVLPEDLIYRFASKLDFGPRTGRVAEDAVRMVKRMSQDWMVMGRRPSGVCGACLILAARMNNFRRTVTEVVYIVKVTTHTIQKRLEEFKLTPSSELTVEEFINNEFLEQAHDPPSFYEKQDDFIKNKKTRKRRRKPMELGEDEEDDDDPNKRQRTEDPIQSVELRRDADGFAIPPLPQDLIDPALVDKESGTTFEQLVNEFGDRMRPAIDQGEPNIPQKRKMGPDNRPIFVPPEWEADEEILESQMSEIINDPHSREHAIAYARAVKRTDAYMLFLETLKSADHQPVSMDTHVGEDEFADDPEVMYCLVPPSDIPFREKTWVNENKGWLRKQQIRAAEDRRLKAGPPKATRKRIKKPRIGEGQTSPASTPGEAAVNVIKTRFWSAKINYKVYERMLDNRTGQNSAATSRATSIAPGSTTESVATDSVANDSPAASVAPSVAASEIDPDDLRDDDDDDDDDGDNTSVANTDADPDHDDWKRAFARAPEEDEYGTIPDDEPEDGMDIDEEAFSGAYGEDNDNDTGYANDYD